MTGFKKRIALYVSGEDTEVEYRPLYKRNLNLRLRTNIELLRQLRKGLEVEEVVKAVSVRVPIEPPEP